MATTSGVSMNVRLVGRELAQARLEAQRCLRCGVCSGLNSHIMWAYQKPLASALRSLP